MSDHRDEAVLAVPPGGLSSAEAAGRLAREGRNVLPPPRRLPLWRRVAAQLRDPLVVVLLAAAILTLATGDWTDASVILLVIVVNTSVGVAQEVRADQAIAALTKLTAPEARVLRDGGQRLIPAAEVVTGDVLVLAEGDIVPADGEVIESAALLVDEASLTGESVPVDKTARQAGEEAVDPVSAGTVVVRGRGRAVVTATGASSAMGRVAALLAAGSGLTPLQRRLVGVGRALAVAAVALSAIVLVVGLIRGQSAELMVVTAISLVVAAVPESLPAVVTLALALGARRMAARNALIRRLPAVETLGSVTVIGTDKTGTLTEGNMVARRLWLPDGTAAEITGTGYEPAGEVRQQGRRLAAGDAPAVTELLTAAALCNDAALRLGEHDGEGWLAVGDPTEAALLAAARKLGLDPGQLESALPRTAELPFDSDRKRMTTAHRLPTGGTRVICKGAPEAVLRAPLLTDPPAAIQRAIAEAGELAAAGFRVLAVASGDRPGEPSRRDQGPGLEEGLRLLGLIAILDPPRASAAGTIAACRAAGISPLLITGDHPATARSIATELGIIAPGDPVIDCRVPAQVAGGARARVYARATPEQKLAIIQARREAGDVVAMTGDGVNDGPALRRADIGVAMGRRGTEVARQAADLVLADDELQTVVAAAEEGRRVYANIRRFLLYGLSGGSAEILVMLAGPLVGLALPLLPAQILWVNLLTHGLPGVALGSEPAEPGTMRRPPRPPAESVLGAGLWQRILRVGLVVAAVTLGVALWGHATGRPWQSMAFFALGATQLAVAAGSRARPGTRANPLLPAAVAVALGLQFAGLYLPILQELLHTQPLSVTDLAIVCALSCLGYAAVRLDRVLFRGPRTPRPAVTSSTSPAGPARPLRPPAPPPATGRWSRPST
jgi:Ca2+-transporting ATPase